MSKISRVLILSLLVVMMAMPVLATTTRIQSLAETGNYIADDANIFRWYGVLPSYSNMVMAEAGRTAGFPTVDVDVSYQALGMNKMIGEYGTIGVYLLFNSIEDQSFLLFNPLITPGSSLLGVSGPTPVSTTKFALAYGYEIEDMLTFAIHFTRSDASTETSPAGTPPAAPFPTVSNTFTTLGAGVRMDAGENAYWDAAFTYGKGGGETANPSVDLWDKATSWVIEGRIFYEWKDDVTLVGHLGYGNWEYITTAQAQTTPIPNAGLGDKGNAFQVGVAANMDVNTNNMLIFAAEWRRVKTEPSAVAPGADTKTEMTSLPHFRLALESDINSWLTTRIGATKEMMKTKTTTYNGTVNTEVTTTGPTTAGGDFEWYLGAGFHVGDWDVDMSLEHDVPFRLGYWLTGYGAQDNDPPITRISGTYRF